MEHKERGERLVQQEMLDNQDPLVDQDPLDQLVLKE